MGDIEDEDDDDDDDEKEDDHVYGDRLHVEM